MSITKQKFIAHSSRLTQVFINKHVKCITIIAESKSFRKRVPPLKLNLSQSDINSAMLILILSATVCVCGGSSSFQVELCLCQLFDVLLLLILMSLFSRNVSSSTCYLWCEVYPFSNLNIFLLRNQAKKSAILLMNSLNCHSMPKLLLRLHASWMRLSRSEA